VTTYETALKDLLKAIPEFDADESLDAGESLRDPTLPFLGYGAFAGFLKRRYLDRGVDAVLRKSFGFLEGLATSGPELENLVEVGVLESIGDLDRGQDNRTAMSALLRISGPRTAYLFRRIEAFWTGTLEEFQGLPPDVDTRSQWPPAQGNPSLD